MVHFCLQPHTFCPLLIIFSPVWIQFGSGSTTLVPSTKIGRNLDRLSEQWWVGPVRVFCVTVSSQCLPAGPFCEGPGERGPTTCNRPIRRGLMARGFPQTTGSNPLNKKYSFLLSWSIFWEGYEGHERVLGSHTHHVKTRTRPSSLRKPREQYPWTRPPPLKVPYANQFEKDSVTRF